MILTLRLAALDHAWAVRVLKEVEPKLNAEIARQGLSGPVVIAEARERTAPTDASTRYLTIRFPKAGNRLSAELADYTGLVIANRSAGPHYKLVRI